MPECMDLAVQLEVDGVFSVPLIRCTEDLAYAARAKNLEGTEQSSSSAQSVMTGRKRHFKPAEWRVLIRKIWDGPWEGEWTTVTETHSDVQDFPNAPMRDRQGFRELKSRGLILPTTSSIEVGKAMV